MRATYFNIYVLLNGTVEVGNSFGSVGEAVFKAQRTECLSFVTMMCIVQNNIVTTVAIARK